MRILRMLSFACLTLVLVPGALARSGQHEHQVESGDPEQLGEVHFPVSCNAAAQQEFNRAVAMLHSFWYYEAEKAFSGVAQKDPDCAMAYWGIAMSRFRQLWTKPDAEDLRVAQEALQKAKTAGTPSKRERNYINALEQFYQGADQVDYLTRKKEYENAMEELAQRYAEDAEATIFYALALLGTAYFSPKDATYARQRKAGALLERIFAKQPNHPGVAHYIIHSYDYPPLADRALEAARRYAKIAPEAPHALHMPTHIFTRLGLWDESIASNRAAAAAARKEQWVGEELHATDYLTYAYLQLAQDSEVGRILKRLPEQRERLRDDDTNYSAGLYAAGAIPARFAVERRQWKGAAALALPVDFFPGGRLCWAEATLYFARGLGAGHTGKLEEARRSLGQLEQCKEVLRQANEKLWMDRVEVQRRAVAAWLRLAEGEEDEALAMMRAAADLEDSTDKPPTMPGPLVPARELLGEMLLGLQRPADARREFEKVLDDSPNRLNAVYGAGRAAELAGDTGEAREYYSTLLELAEAAGVERPTLSHAKAFLNNTPRRTQP